MISLMYAAGLRVSELVHLKVKELNIKDSYGWIRHGKGNKDRLFIVAENLKEDINSWIEENILTNNSYLFTGYNNTHLSARSVLSIVKKAARVAGIGKNVHPHTFRHSFATHVAEKGHAIDTLQNLLGHVSPDTSMTYIHAAAPARLKVESPYDNL